MSVRTFDLPDLGEGLEDAEIVEWHVEVGMQVALNAPLCTVETAKAEVQIPSPFAGTVVELGAPAGGTVDVGSPLVRIDIVEAPEDVIDLSSGGAADERPQPVLVGYGATAPAARRRRRPRPARDDDAASGAGRAAEPVLAKPAVRKLARDLGVDLASLTPGNGPAGSITRDAVIEAAGHRTELHPGEAHPDEHHPSEDDAADTDAELVAVRGVQSRMVDAMARSHEVPTAGAGRWVDCTALLVRRTALRQAARRDRAAAADVTPFGLVARAMVVALRDHRALNASYDAQRRAVHRFRAVHLGVAVDTPRGLLVPVIRDADRLSLVEFLAELERITGGARDGTLAPAELGGSTASISNFGAFGLDDGWPMLNPPEALIVGVGSIRERAVAVEGALAVRPTVKLTCSFDHRVADGADVGRFMAAFAQLIEEPNGLDGT